MNYSKQELLAGAEALDRAHDILLESGVTCHETKCESAILSRKEYTPEGKRFSPCLWEAAIMGLGLSCDSWGRLYDMQDYPNIDWPEGSQAVREVLNDAGKTWSWNDDEARVDDVFEAVRESAKTLREQAGQL